MERKDLKMAVSSQLVAALVNAYAGAVISVSQTLGIKAEFHKTQMALGVNAPGSRVAALIGIVGCGVHGTAALMADQEGFTVFVNALTGGMIQPDPDDPMAMSVLGELTNMTSGQALIKVNMDGLDITPPQLLSGENIKAVPQRGSEVKNFTLPFTVGESGRIFLVLSFNSTQ